jgi:flagellar motor switch protein FliG
LVREPPQLAAAILARLEPQHAATVLALMPVERQAAVVRRVSKLTELPASALEEVATALAAELPSTDGAASIGIDGMAKAAQILNAAEKEVAGGVLSTLESGEPDLSRELRLAMFTFPDLARLEPRSMRTLLKEIPTERLTLALKGAPEDVLAAIFGGLSSRAVDVIRDELELIGNPRKADVDRARTEIIEAALRLESEGALDLGRGG